MNRRWWVLRWRVLRVVVGLPMWLGIALWDGLGAFRLKIAGGERPRHGQARAAYEEIVEGHYR